MHAIPTTYGGVNFRSRLEARWAAFFDLLGLSWEYEPVDLKGYIPDFRLSLAETSLYAEVKPVDHTRGFDSAIAKMQKAYYPDVLTFENSDFSEGVCVHDAVSKKLLEVCPHEFLFLGSTPLLRYNGPSGPPLAFGVLVSRPLLYETRFAFVRGAVVLTKTNVEGRDAIEFRYVQEKGLLAVNYTQAWREAGNRVQWKAREQERLRLAEIGNSAKRFK